MMTPGVGRSSDQEIPTRGTVATLAAATLLVLKICGLQSFVMAQDFKLFDVLICE